MCEISGFGCCTLFGMREGHSQNKNDVLKYGMLTHQPILLLAQP